MSTSPNPEMARCPYSDLRRSECDHCTPADHSAINLDPPHPKRATATRREPTQLRRPEMPTGWAPVNTSGECRCGKQSRDDMWLCDQCQVDLTTTLADLGALEAEITTTMTRETAAALTGSARSATVPLPWNDKAATALRTLHGILAQWVRFCDEESVRGPDCKFPTDRVPVMAAWLATRVHGLALLDIGPEALDEITDAAAECHRLVFWKRKARVYLGACGHIPDASEDDPNPTACPGEVYADDEDEPVGYCDECGQGVTVVIRRAQLDAELAGYLATAAEVARLATYLGLDAPRDVVRKRVLYWHRHKRIEQRGTAADGAPMFRYGDVRSLLYADFAARVA